MTGQHHRHHSSLRASASRLFPAGALGTFALPKEHGFLATGGLGTRIHTDDGRELLDFVLGSGPLILATRTRRSALPRRLPRPSRLRDARRLGRYPCAH